MFPYYLQISSHYILIRIYLTHQESHNSYVPEQTTPAKKISTSMPETKTQWSRQVDHTKYKRHTSNFHFCHIMHGHSLSQFSFVIYKTSGAQGECLLIAISGFIYLEHLTAESLRSPFRKILRPLFPPLPFPFPQGKRVGEHTHSQCFTQWRRNSHFRLRLLPLRMGLFIKNIEPKRWLNS